MGLLSRLAAACLAAAASGYNVARTPPMGWNSWNHFGCSVNETILQGQATAMNATGLQAAGYEYVNSDDCWMLDSRDAQGNLIPNPSKFPSGLSATVSHIHSLGLKSGLYTARATNTCAGFMGACGHEAQDAAWYAAQLVDYLKDDACGSCGSDSWEDSYGKMQQGIWAAGRSMVLSVEGDPDPRVITYGGYGNMRRVGHDISPHFKSMVSLVDIGAGLWPYAHNASNTSVGGWWNDLDMIEIGNGEFSGPGSELLSQAHFSMWAIMKAPLILGGDLTAIDPVSLSIMANPEAIAVNQDAWGIQGRRTSVHMPRNTSLGTVAGSFDSVAVVSPCDAADPTQQWTFVNRSSGPRNLLYLVPCNANDPYQQWDFASGAAGQLAPLANVGSGQCVDAAGQFDPAQLLPCADIPSQQWAWNSSSLHLYSTKPAHCLDVYDFTGPDVELGSCKDPGAEDSNQQWQWNSTTRQLRTMSAQSGQNICLAAASGPVGGLLQTSNPANASQKLCLYNGFGEEGGWAGVDCSTLGRDVAFTLRTSGGPAVNGVANFSFASGGSAANVNNQFGASGPWPHTRYISGFSWSSGTLFSANLSALVAAGASTGTPIRMADGSAVYDDDLVGHVTVGGDFCLALRTLGMLEVWTAPLSGGRYAAALFNRSPGADDITLSWSDLDAWFPTTGAHVPSSARFAVRDIWAAADKGTFTGAYTASALPAHAVALLVLTPA